MTSRQLHHLLIRHVIDTGHVPDSTALAKTEGLALDRVGDGMRELARIHGVILEPNSLRVWSLHPFALMPTAFWVAYEDRGWWANCAWCALGIGAAIHVHVRIVTRSGAEGEPLEFDTSRPPAGLVTHFPQPPSRWWDNPYSPCGNILFFSSEASIDAWCARHGRPKGSVLSIDKAMALAERWFGDYASPDWKRKTPQQANAIFAELELDPAFWRVSDTFE